MGSSSLLANNVGAIWGGTSSRRCGGGGGSASISFKTRRFIHLTTTTTTHTNRVSARAGGDGGGGGGSVNGKRGGGGDRDDNNSNDDKNKMSMSQKLTLGYAALVGVGGVMGYVKSGSQKSLAAGGLSALILYYVYTQLPIRPAFASSLGFGLSAALLGVMGSRFKKSGKIFPAGLVSFFSFVMTGGYLHGILRSLH